ncbi:hypothetical protein J0X19_08830 [Hymenobacter sp. BT186]|uniref:Uncharacterized protein n=1 Tax=Hymenobacter telluris TaxID=2816474 RepID=A0A939JC67_9BACT|nr:hypothetical protein [Hymenobacter telluris]MBO0358045.1 hypothetical protein [Hymenobacter telluris]MBW3374072.1 hypothetical protein [Hymenobacter norwichensis]
MPRLTCSQLQEVGFQPCTQPPHGWQYAGDVYVRQLPSGPVYVLCVKDSDEVEVFIGDWMNPLEYYYWPTADPQKITAVLSESRL